MAKGIGFSEFLLLKKQEKERNIGKSLSLTKFAKSIGFSVSLVSYWMNEKGNPSIENINKLAYQLGPEVYDVLDMQRPDPVLEEIRQVYNNISPTEKSQMVKMIRNWANEHGYEVVEQRPESNPEK